MSALVAENITMGTTFVSIQEKGFWMRDSFLELWLRLLALHVEDAADANSVAHEIRTQWLLASRGYFTGCVPDHLQEYVSTEEGKRIVLNAIGSLLGALRSAPPALDRGVLNVLGMSGSFGQDIDTSRLLEIGDAFVDLIEGRLATQVSDRRFVPAP